MAQGTTDGYLTSETEPASSATTGSLQLAVPAYPATGIEPSGNQFPSALSPGAPILGKQDSITARNKLNCKRISDVAVLPACRSNELPSIISGDQTCTGNAPTRQSSRSEHFIQTCM